MMEVISKNCRECQIPCDVSNAMLRIFPKKTHYIEAIQQWVIANNFFPDKRSFEGQDVWTYCYDCYIRHSLDTHGFRCLNCGVYDTYGGNPPILKKNSNYISGNGAIGSFHFIDQKPECLNQDGKLCSICLQNLILERIIVPDSSQFLQKITNLPTLLPEQKNISIFTQVCVNCSSLNKHIDDDYYHVWHQFINPSICFSGHRFYKLSPHSNTIYSETPSSNVDNLETDIPIESDTDSDSSEDYNPIDNSSLFSKLSSLDSSLFPVSICSECISYINLETKIESIVCDLCQYETEQDICGGHSCANYIQDTGVFCGYGSLFDMSRYRWSSGGKPMEYKNIKTVCDQCLRNMIDNNIIIEDGDYM